MLKEIKIPQSDKGSGFYKQFCKIPKDPATQNSILAIQIHLSPQEANLDPRLSAVELMDCLSVISLDVLKELRKLLPES